jgi:hypothetical protein
MAVEMWKTLRIWMSLDAAFDANGPDLTLVTTSIAPAGSAAHAVQPASSGVWDVAGADEILAAAV